MKKVEILVDQIFGEKNAKYHKGDIVEVSDAVAEVFGDRCKVLDEPKKVKKKTASKTVKKNEG